MLNYQRVAPTQHADALKTFAGLAANEWWDYGPQKIRAVPRD